MKKEEFLEELADILELKEKNVDFDTPVSLDSLSVLSVIAFLDDNFSKKASADQFSSIKTINDIVKLAGEENIK